MNRSAVRGRLRGWVQGIAALYFAASVTACGDNQLGAGRTTGTLFDAGVDGGSSGKDSGLLGPADVGTALDGNVLFDGAGLSDLAIVSDGANTSDGASVMRDGSLQIESGVSDDGGSRNACDPNPCMNGGTCTATGGDRFRCACAPGFLGDRCESAVDPCGVNNGGCDPLVICISQPGAQFARRCGPCPPGYHGDGETGCMDIDECATVRGACAVNATCTNRIGGFDCACNTGLFGDGHECHTLGALPVLSAGNYHSCARATDGTIRCWGADWRAQTRPPAGPALQVGAGVDFACALAPDRTVACWGDNWAGQQSPIADANGFVAITVGGDNVCGLRTDLLVTCWGDSDSGQSGPPGDRFIQISAGYAHACGVRGNGTIACWGDNASGQSRAPAGTFTQVAAGADHTCGLRTNGTVVCWGANGSRQTTAPTGTFVQISAGGRHSCGVRAAGAVACWGDNAFGQSTARVGVFTEVSAGFTHTCGLTASGSILCWGDNENGQSAP